MERTDWDSHFLIMAYTAAAQSKDISTKVGSIIVGPNRDIRATGYNGPPRGFNDSDPRLSQRPEKYLLTEHAERNSLYQCARNGISCENTSLYVTWMPCVDCGRGIVQSGIKRVIVHKQGNDAYHVSNLSNTQWNQDLVAEMLQDCGVQLDWYSKPLPAYVVGQFGGKRYHFDTGTPTEIQQKGCAL